MTQLRRFPAETQEDQTLDADDTGIEVADYDLDEDGESVEPGTPGSLLRDLERRQDEVLAKLDELNAKIEAVLVSLGVKLDEEPVAA